MYPLLGPCPFLGWPTLFIWSPIHYIMQCWCAANPYWHIAMQNTDTHPDATLALCVPFTTVSVRPTHLI